MKWLTNCRFIVKKDKIANEKIGPNEISVIHCHFLLLLLSPSDLGLESL